MSHEANDCWFREYWGRHLACGKFSLLRWGPWTGALVFEGEETEEFTAAILNRETLDELIEAAQQLKKQLATRYEAVGTNDLGRVDPPNQYPEPKP